MTVYLVGAGPGDPGLMTARALELIATADVIIYDRLIPAAALAGRPGRGRAAVRRQGGRRPVGLTGRDRASAAGARRCGAAVVRLKGGDPFVFGRGGEEAETLRRAGIAFEVVPGVTAGVAAPAYAGIPVTHRDAASAVAFVTGHEDPAKPESALDWAALAAFPGTLVVYMGVRRLEAIAAQLVAGGRPASEPAAVIAARHAARPAGGRRNAGHDRRRGPRRRDPSPGGRRVRPGGGAAREAGLARGAAAGGADHRRDPRAGAGQRARRSAQRARGARPSRRRRSGSSRSRARPQIWGAMTSCA